jgi:N-dimethylarginine dimethylaminohydrolase
VTEKKILMCPPDYFEIKYSINPWMNPAIRVNKEEAFKQYNALKNAFEKAGGKIIELVPGKNLPDMVYTSNAGYAEGDVFIKANFKAHQRQHESNNAEKYFKHNGYQVFDIPENIIFEGEGDLIRSKSKYFFGWGQRSDLIANDYLEDIIGKEIISLELVNPYFYHLDTCLAPLNDNIVVINDSAFSEESLVKIYEKFRTVITTNEQDNSVLASNLLVIDNTVFIGKGISDDLKEGITKLKFKVIETEMSEFLKGGGSVKCLALEIF